MSTPKCSAALRNAAVKAAKANARAAAVQSKWVELFEAEFGHTDISDALVEVIDYSTGSTAILTREYIAEWSNAEKHKAH